MNDLERKIVMGGIEIEQNELIKKLNCIKVTDLDREIINLAIEAIKEWDYLKEELIIRMNDMERSLQSLHKKLDKGVTVSVAKLRPEDLLGVPLVGGK